MAYIIGASHGPFTGSGSFAISKPAGIKTVLSGISGFSGHDGGSPRRYFKLGRMSLGNVDGFQFSHGLEYVQQLLYPVAPVWELLAYDLKGGATCTFWELVDVPDMTLKQPWDRTPQSWRAGNSGNYGGSTGTTTGFTYTVPVGRRLFVQQASAILTRVSDATTLNGATGTMLVDNQSILKAQLFINGIGQVARHELGAGGLLLAPGQVISSTYAQTDDGGVVAIDVRAAGYLFDA